MAPAAGGRATCLEERRVLAATPRSRSRGCPACRPPVVRARARARARWSCRASPTGKHRVRELVLRQREEKVRLILGRIGAALQYVAAGCGIEIDPRVVACRDEVGAEPLGAADERRELEVAIAVDARNRRPSRRVLADEIRDDGVGELTLEIDDVVRESRASPRRGGRRGDRQSCSTCRRRAMREPSGEVVDAAWS